MKKNKISNIARLKHIVNAINEIKKYTKNINFHTFENNSMINQASIRQLEIIGEACNRITDDLKKEYSNVA